MKKETQLAHAGRKPEKYDGAVNVPVYRASTILHPSVAEMEESGKHPFEGVRYGRFGTPTTHALEEAVAVLEGGERAIATSSGLAAITGALMAFLKTGDHLLMTDSAYFPTRKFCDTVLAGLGIETTYYDPLIGGGIAALMRPNTRVVFTESPGSLTFEVQDIPAIAAAAHEAGAVVMLDNTWGVLNFQPFAKGVDVSIQAATKYIVGHADAMLGVITTTDAHWLRIKSSLAAFGASPGTEEMFLGLRGLRSLAVRLKNHAATALRLTQWLERQPEVARVLYPPLPSDPGHALWQRDFSGGCGLFGVILNDPWPKPALDAMLDGYRHFKLGYSWGGFESLVIPTTGHAIIRTATRWQPPGPSVRFHAGMEDADDLLEDLELGFQRLRTGG